jgi:hypothetical protein
MESIHSPSFLRSCISTSYAIKLKTLGIKIRKVNAKFACLTMCHVTKLYGGKIEVIRSTHFYFRYGLDKYVETDAPAALPRGRKPRTYCIGVWVGPEVGTDAMETRKISVFLGIYFWNASRPARSLVTILTELL